MSATKQEPEMTFENAAAMGLSTEGGRLRRGKERGAERGRQLPNLSNCIGRHIMAAEHLTLTSPREQGASKSVSDCST